MSDLILFLRSHRKTRRFGFPLLWTIKAAWQWRKPTPELVKMFNTNVPLKLPTEKSDVELITKLAKAGRKAWDRADELKAENTRLREALSFYADDGWKDRPLDPPTRQETEIYGDCILDFPTPEVLFDRGDRARAALKGKKP